MEFKEIIFYKKILKAITLNDILNAINYITEAYESDKIYDFIDDVKHYMCSNNYIDDEQEIDDCPDEFEVESFKLWFLDYTKEK